VERSGIGFFGGGGGAVIRGGVYLILGALREEWQIFEGKGGRTLQRFAKYCKALKSFAEPQSGLQNLAEIYIDSQ